MGIYFMAMLFAGILASVELAVLSRTEEAEVVARARNCTYDSRPEFCKQKQEAVQGFSSYYHREGLNATEGQKVECRILIDLLSCTLKFAKTNCADVPIKELAKYHFLSVTLRHTVGHYDAESKMCNKYMVKWVTDCVNGLEDNCVKMADKAISHSDDDDDEQD